MLHVNMDLTSTEKCEVKKDSITFFGIFYDANGADPDPKKVDVTHEMPPPENQSQLQQYIGMVTYLSPFITLLCTLHLLGNC